MNSSPPMRVTRSVGLHVGAQTLGDLDEQLVAVAVAERVVDQLEAVEVEEEQRDVGVVDGRLLQQLRRGAAPSCGGWAGR